MKKITYSLLLSFMATFFFLSSCKKKEAEEVVKPAPTLAFLSGPGMTSGNITVIPGQSFKVGWSVNASGGNLKSFSLNRDGNVVKEFNNGIGLKSISGASYSETISITAPEQVQSYNYVFTVTTDDGKTASSTINVKVANQIGEPIAIYTGQVLGAPSNTNIGSFFSITSGKIYLEDDAKLNESIIDLVYFTSAEIPYIGSPYNETALEKFPKLATWSTRNLTYFKPTSSEMTSNVFDAITGDNKIVYEFQTATGAGESKSLALTVGKVVSFLTKNNKKGLIKITNITTGVNGSITFDVKVQK